MLIEHLLGFGAVCYCIYTYRNSYWSQYERQVCAWICYKLHQKQSTQTLYESWYTVFLKPESGKAIQMPKIPKRPDLEDLESILQALLNKGCIGRIDAEWKTLRGITKELV